MREENFVPAKVVNFGYSSTGASTLGFLRKIDSAAQDAEGGSEANRQLNGSSTLSGRGPEHGEAGPGTGEGTGNGDGAVGGGAPSLSALSVDGQAEAAAVASNNAGVRERYKSLVRQLPPRVFVERLVDIFFRDFNWQYYTVDEDVFRDQLARWNAVPFSVLSASGPMALSPDMRAFPALLFQVVATALLVLPDDEPDETFDTLKYGDMTFEDLALDYSESGMAVLSLLGKRHMSLTTVLAGFARAAFLKYTGMVTEAWHAIGSAIRDGQEIGLHRDSMDPRPASSDVGDVLENQWLIQRRRRLWVTLVGWDLHTGVILGRPLTIDSRPDREPAVFTMPVDAPIPRDRRSTPVVARNELDDPPTPLTRALWAYRCMAPLRDILDLERDGPCPKDFSKVDEMERRLRELQDQTPPYFRLENPDERFDSLPECYWLPYVRANLPQLIQFNFMALHRPYIFTRKRSRTEALKASLEMLQVQRMHFLSLKPNHFKM